MSVFSLSKILALLQKANEQGVTLSFVNNELSVNFQKGKTVDKSFLDELRQNKPHLVQYFENFVTKKEDTEKVSIQKVNRNTELIPLSFAQERLWFIHQLEGSVQYHLPTVLKLKGKLNQTALQNALQSVVNRHEILRTVIRQQDGKGFQQVKPQDEWRLEIVHGAHFINNPEGLQYVIRQLISRPFDLAKDDMLRAVLISISEEEYVLVLTIHHIASDAWSDAVLIKEVIELYRAGIEERAANLPVLDIQYADYAYWQRKNLQGSALDEKLDYWKEKLGGVSPLQLPTDFVRPVIQSRKGDTLVFSIDKALTDELNVLSRKQGTTLFITLLAIYKVLLARYSGQTDITVGTSFARRGQTELENLIGFFVNTLALRDEVDAESSFTDLLQQVKTTSLGAYENQDIPFEKVVEVAARERDSSRSPLFQVMLVLANTPQLSRFSLHDLEFSHELYEEETTKFEITFFFSESKDGLQGSVQYSTDLYTAATIERMIQHFEVLLRSVVANPTQRVGKLTMLGNEEQQSLVSGINLSSAVYPEGTTVTALFEEQAARVPGNTAVVFEGKEITYKQLNETANQLAHALQRRGVKPGSLVPLYINRSIEMIIGILGILKAGAAYVPIDTDFPAERIRYMLQDTGANLVVSSRSARHSIDPLPGIEVIAIEDIAGESSENITLKPSATDLAYIIYTSGSTGNPKGVMIEHRNLVDYYYGLDKATGISNCSSFALVSTIATDLGNTVIYGSLLSGGALHVFTKEAVSNIEYLHRYFHNNSIECVKIVPSHWKALKNEEALLLPVKLLIFGGEALQPEDVAAITQSGNSCQVVNHYGPTETTIGKLLHEVKPGSRYPKTIPIGKPFGNTAVYVLSKELQVCPLGVPGQLYISGHGVAPGYYNKAELTQEKFVTNPFSMAEGAAMYATGDLVKWLADGNIEFIGRVDNQVKIHGYRIELGEIESILQQSGLVSQAAVLARADQQGNKRLVGYVVPAGYFDRQEILEYLQQKLPEYMIPAVLVDLEQMPLMANGKIDRKALPDPDLSALLSDQYLAPRNETEVKLAAIWADVLEVDEVGVHDDFFELGGHSLLAVRLVSAIRKAFGVEMPIGDIFDYPTVGQLSAQLSAPSDIVLLPPVTRQFTRPDQIPLSFSQERLWFIDQLGGSLQYHIPAILRLTGNLNTAALQHALQGIIRRHEVLRTVIVQEGGLGYQSIKNWEDWKLQTTDGSAYRENTGSLQQYIKESIEEPFNLSADYMLRAILIQLNQDDHVLVATLHHIASDGWSTSIMVKELAELYNSYTEDRPADLPQLPVQYADYALWQRKYLQGEAWEKKLSYWKEKLEDTAVLQLSTDYVRPLVQSIRGAVTGFRLEKALSERLSQLSQRHGATLFMTMLAAFKVLLYRYSGQQDICVGTPIAGRQQSELEGLIGFFVNTLALRTEVKGSSSFVELLNQVRSTTLEAYDHQEVPFEKVVELVVKDRDMSRSPLFQVMFVLQNTAGIEDIQLGGLQLSPAGQGLSGHVTSKFDLTFTVTEHKEGLAVSVEYCTDLYNDETISQLSGHFRNLLQSVVSSPDQSIGTLPMLTEVETQYLLQKLNDTKEIFSTAGKTVIDLFEEQVIKNPHATALVYDGERINYGELNERSNRLAHYLIKKGVKADSLVPVCMNRGTGLVTAILAILKAGGAYVPIDPEYPDERIRYMLKDTGAFLLLTNGERKGLLPKEETENQDQSKKIEIIELPSIKGKLETEAISNPGAKVTGRQLAYVIYTSGSTGKPKGVMIAHAALSNLVHWHNREYGVSPASYATAMAGVGFDAFGWEVWPYLSCGASLLLLDDSIRLNPSALLRELTEKEVTHSFIATALIPDFIEVSAGKQSALQYVLTGGDKLGTVNSTELSYTLVNNYGPTENTVVTSYYKLRNKAHLVPPIGKPISNTVIYLLSEEGELVPHGAAGELCIGGSSLARGYLNLPELTAQQFIKDPFNNEEGARIYKTGDLCRWLDTDNLEYIGRKDEQVKIRGYRIELGEIERIIEQSEMVIQSVVLAKEDKEGSKQLTGFIVIKDGYRKEKLITFLSEQLPAYMIPRFWRELDRLPLTANGKVDKKLLLQTDVEMASGDEYVAPRTQTEEKLVLIWQELLGVERVGINDNFFELGGHSLMAMRMVSAIRSDLNIEVAIMKVFTFPTVATLVSFLDIHHRGFVLPPIEVFPKPEHIPLSFSQERLWFIDQLEGSIQYHLPTVLQLKGNLNKAALHKVIWQILERHEVLRTIYYELDGKAYQRLKEPNDWRLDMVDGSKYRDEKEALQSRVKKMINSPFDLSKDYMLRAELISLEENDHLLVVTMHHIASDGWSLSLLVEEFEILYKRYTSEQVYPLTPIQIQYVDFAIWQRKYLSGEILADKIGYWKDKLEGISPLQLPTDRRRPLIQTSNGAKTTFILSEKVVSSIKRLGKQQNTTLYMTLLAAFKALLFRYTMQADISVGSPVANRPQKEVEALIGFFVNTLVLRSNIQDSLTFTELLQQVKQTTLEAFEYQDVPFEKVVEAVSKERDLARSPLFQVTFALQNTPEIKTFNLGELEVLYAVTNHSNSKFDMSYSLIEKEDLIHGTVEYNTDIYDLSTINRMVAHYTELIHSIIDNPDEKLGSLSLLSKEEKQHLLSKGTTGKYAYQSTNIVALFEAQVQQRFRAFALIYEQEKLSYLKLNERANQLAHYLREKGVKEETLVPVFTERSLNMIVAILAILKAGGAYVPIDPAYPAERINYMLQDISPGLIISSRHISNHYLNDTAIELIEMDGKDFEVIRSYPTENLNIEINESQLAYVMYTSGSTGTPKGILVEHKNVTSLVKEVDYVSLTNEDIIISTGSPSFDASTFEYWGALLNGGQLILCDEDTLLNIDLLKEEISSCNVSVMWFTATWFNQLVDSDISIFEGLKTILVGGEKLSPKHIEEMRKIHPSIKLINGYGPTENTTFSLTYEISETHFERSVPIGRPLSGRYAYILDQHLQPVPVGIAGEIYLGGSGLSRGYLNQPALTAEKFIDNPFGPDKGARLYRTGDIGRWLTDDTIEYMERLDDQVKIRGHRIELGEIEHAINQSDLVDQSVVVVTEDKEGLKRLTGYLVMQHNQTIEAVTDYLSSRLPKYMIPQLWVSLQKLPLTANGKVDKKALPHPDVNLLVNHDFVGPRNVVEEQLAAIWQKLLGLEQVGIYDNFFELGGDSILTIQVVSRMRKLGYDLKPGDIFIHQQIADLASAINANVRETTDHEQGELTGVSGLLPIQQWYFSLDPTEISYFNQSILLRIDKSISAGTLALVFKQLIAQHDALRFRYTQFENEWIQEYSQLEFEVVTEALQSEPAEQGAAIIQQKANQYQHSLDIEKGDLLRVVLLQTPLTETHNRLLIVIHHLVIDGVSWRILLEDMDAMLDAYFNQKQITPAVKTSSYRQWYEALENFSKSNNLLTQKNYWQNIKQSFEPLPVDKTYKGIIRAGNYRHLSLRLNEGQTRQLLQTAPKAYHTEINDILLTALGAALTSWTRNNKVVIGLEGHGRESIGANYDTSRTVGWFTNLFPLLLEINHDKSEGDHLKSVKEQLRKVPNRGLGYGVLKYINKEDSLKGGQCWDIVFNYLGQLDHIVNESNWLSAAPESPGVSVGKAHELTDKISISCSVQVGELVIHWNYSELHFEDNTIHSLASAHLTQLKGLIEHCVNKLASGSAYTPSDYGLGKEVGYEELDAFLEETINGKKRRQQVESMYGLSGLQQGMLFHGVYDGQAAAYIEQFVCDLIHADTSLLIRAWQHVLNNHSSLRSAFYHDSFTIPVQVVYKEVILPVSMVDYSELNSEEQHISISKYEAADREKTFDFKAAPLIRMSLIKLNAERYHMLWTTHHILFDGWSLPLLMEDFLFTYESLKEGTVPAEKETDKYEDYIRYVERRDKEAEENYWRNYLKGVEQSTLLPYISITKLRNKGAGEYLSQVLEYDEQETMGIQKFTKKHRLTINTLVQGIWSFILHQYTGSKNIVYGVIVSGRPDDMPNVEKRVGMYINTLPLHSTITENQPVIGWLQQLQHQQVDSRQYQYTPLHQIQAWTGVQGDLFDSILVFENYPLSEVINARKWSLDIENVQMHDQTNYPLGITVNNKEKITVAFRYNSELLEAFHMQQIRDHFDNVLKQIIATDEAGILENIELITQDERTRLLADFHTSANSKTGDTVLDLFEKQVRLHPEAIALVFATEEISFAGLNERSNQLAHYLKKNGVTRNSLVPICLERSAEMLIAILGILKAGAAYVPIDPDYPSERISYMVQDLDASIIITNQNSMGNIEANSGLTLLSLDLYAEAIANQSKENLSFGIKANDLAYVIYTSGSTGIPKGVMVEHGSLYNYLLNNKTHYINETEKDHSGSFVHLSYTFDASLTGLLMPLLFGKSVIIGSQKSVDVFEDSNLHKYAPYDFIKITPSHIKLLEAKMRMADGRLITNKLIIGGEALTSSHLEYLVEEGMDVTIVNEYGPTESTVGCSIYTVNTLTDKDKIQQSTGISIGKPIENVDLFILSDNNKLLPVGVPGELCISGAGLARGYLNRPDLTAEKFVANPFANEVGQKMYKTGDIASWSADGNINYLGRKDEQVKIRGYRVELGEIEAALQQSVLVQQAVVLAREDSSGSKRLIGFIVPSTEYDKDELLLELKKKLPDYMIPSALVEIESLPLTSNGKIDKKALPEVGSTDEFIGGYAAPRNDAEQVLCDIWQDVLEVERVGIEDDFFDLGGHSLLAIRLISVIRKKFMVEMQISEIFNYPTVKMLAGHLQNNDSKESNTPILPQIEVLQQRPAQIPLSFSQERLWFIDQLEGSIQYHIPAVLRLKGKLNKDALEFALQQVVNRHEILRTVINEKNGEGFQVIRDENTWQLDSEDFISDKTEANLNEHIRQLINKPFNLQSDHMLRGDLIRLEENDHVIVLTIHHIASDGWSASIIVRELVELLKSYVENREADLPILPLQYADFAIWQRKYLQGELLNNKLAFWKEYLNRVEPLQLPLDHARPAVQSTKGASEIFNIDKELTQDLHQLSRRENASIFMTLLAAFKVLLYRYSGQEDICVGTPIAGRQQPELEGLIGFFVNTLALRTQLSESISYTELLQQVRENTLKAYEHQDVPFEKVVEAVVKDREINRNPLFQVMFILQNTPKVEEPHFGEMELSYQPLVHNTTKFDLTFGLSETENGISGSVEYCPDLFNKQTIERMVVHFKSLLKAISVNPQELVASLPMLTKTEEAQLLVGFNDTRMAFPEDRSITDLFEEQVTKTPDRTAVIFEDASLTYKELNERSNRLAHYLRSQGVKENTLVPIFIERSLEMIIGVLAILKAGGVYVPIDPEYPAKRIAHILEEVHPALILSTKAESSKLAGLGNFVLLEMDGDHADISSQPVTNPQSFYKPGNLAYLLYTSGSTGIPKGVKMPAKALVNLLTWQEKQFTNKHRHVLQFASLNFDVSFQEIFSTLCFGSTLYLINAERRKDITELLRDIVTFRITHLFVPYIVLKNMADSLAAVPGHPFRLEEVIVAGEQLKLTPDIQSLLDKNIGRIINQYGPTEAHVVSSYMIEPGGILPALPPIGKPIANTHLYILGKNKQLVPVGVSGELYIGGVQVAEGYLNQPVLTTEKFITDFLSDQGGMLYKTGDIARWLPDGNMEYLGRADDQVKIRGYRIEPGEIETVLQQFEAVEKAVVIAREDKHGNKQLVAYIVPHGLFNRQAISDYLKTKLPAYMVPSLWVEIDSIPVTINGKINRKVLPDPDLNNLAHDNYVAPRNDDEKILAEIWQNLLGIDRVGIQDNFFELGGHSLLAMRVVSMIRKELEVELSLSVFFKLATIEKMAGFIKVNKEEFLIEFEDYEEIKI